MSDLSFMASNYAADYVGTYAPSEARYRIVNAGQIVMGVGGTPLTQLAVTSRRDVAERVLPLVREQMPNAEVYELAMNEERPTPREQDRERARRIDAKIADVKNEKERAT